MQLFRSGQHTALEVLSCQEDSLLNGCTPLHLAVGACPDLFMPGSKAYNEAIQALCAAGANPFLENDAGRLLACFAQIDLNDGKEV